MLALREASYVEVYVYLSWVCGIRSYPRITATGHTDLCVFYFPASSNAVLLSGIAITSSSAMVDAFTIVRALFSSQSQS
jgi:hypothetical protein